MIEKDVFISGPINIVRLEGDVLSNQETIKKTLYLFFDIHVGTTECIDIKSINIEKYLYKIIDKQNKTHPQISYDLFLETFSSRISDYDSGLKGEVYLEHMRKFFSYLDKDDKHKSIKNLRLHYFDVRDVFTMEKFTPNGSLFSKLRYLIRTIAFEHNTHPGSFKACDEILAIHIKKITQMHFLFSNEIKYIKSDKRVDSDDINDNLDELTYDIFMNNIIYKLKYKYNNKNIEDKLNKIINIYLTNLSTELLENLKKLRKMLTEVQDTSKEHHDDLYKSGSLYEEIKLNKKLYNFHEFSLIVFDKLRKLLVNLTDVFFIRRYLDKNYINHGLHYAGAYHSTNVINILVKYFDFKITNVTYASIPIDEMEAKFKKSTDVYDLRKFVIPSRLYQCSNLKGFPANFL